MNRRSALKQVALFAGGIAFLPSCNFGPERVTVALKHLHMDADQQDLLARIVEIIIPSGETPGGEALELHRFVLVMVDDCAPKADQDIFVSGLQQIEAFVKEHVGKSFSDSDQAKNEKILTDLMGMDDAKEEAMPGLKDVKAFLSLTKRYSIQGYMSSQYMMTEVFPYQLVPGKYQACVSTEGLKVM